MKFIESLREALEADAAIRRPEMVGYVCVADRTASVTVSASQFGTAVGHKTGTYPFSYNGSSWRLNGAQVSLSSYGITLVAGSTAVDGDTISVEYSRSGTSDIAVPSFEKSDTSFVKTLTFTNWDLEDPASGVTTVSFTVSYNSDWVISSVSAPVIVPSGISSFRITAYLMTAILADDWFVTTVEESQKAHTGGTLW